MFGDLVASMSCASAGIVTNNVTAAHKTIASDLEIVITLLLWVAITPYPGGMVDEVMAKNPTPCLSRPKKRPVQITFSEFLVLNGTNIIHERVILDLR